MKTLTSVEFNALLREDFCSFVQRSFHELYPSTAFAWNWHVELMAAKLADCVRGKIRRLIMNVPPRHLKSLGASNALPAWYLGHNPAAQILCASYGMDLAEKLARDCRSIMLSSFYQRAFATRLSPQKQSAHEFETTAAGFRFATSVGGPLTGRGADMIILDDPLKADEAYSDAQRRSVNNWYDQALLSRLNNRETGCIIIVTQRLHEDDLVGHVLGRESWEVISLPAIAEQDETHIIGTPQGEVRFHRKKGEAIHPARESRDVFDSTRKDVGESIFAAQWQQAPLALSQGFINEAWFKRFNKNQTPTSFDAIVQSWDTGNKVGPDCSFSVCTTWGVLKEHYYLLDVWRQRVDFGGLKRAVRSQAQVFRATVILVEDKASGTQLIQELRAEGVHGITPYLPQGDKQTRMHAQAGVIGSGFVHVLVDAHWLPAYIKELCTYPATQFDDQVDSTSQFLEWNRGRTHQFPCWGIFEFYRLEAEKALGVGSGERMVRLKVPHGTCTTFYTILGKRIPSIGGTIVEVTEEEAKYLRPRGFIDVQDGE
jgi:predicted phage terminase large subunit-like protein